MPPLTILYLSIYGSCNCLLTPFAASQPTDSTTSPLAGRLFVVIGAGGAGKALAYGAKEKGARVVIANRTFGICFFRMLLLNKFNHISA